eukprot:1476275-Rhodomonas_salina.1
MLVEAGQRGRERTGSDREVGAGPACDAKSIARAAAAHNLLRTPTFSSADGDAWNRVAAAGWANEDRACPRAVWYLASLVHSVDLCTLPQQTEPEVFHQRFRLPRAHQPQSVSIQEPQYGCYGELVQSPVSSCWLHCNAGTDWRPQASRLMRQDCWLPSAKRSRTTSATACWA